MAKDKEIIFVQHHEPPMFSGEYDLQVIAEATLPTSKAKKDNRSYGTKKTKEIFHSQYKIVVKGERLSLSEKEIHSVFPPENTSGKFNKDLPFIVLKNPSLPWERQMTIEEGEKNSTPYPWMALLTFHEKDPIPGEIKVGLDALGSALPKDTYHPPFSPEFGEKEHYKNNVEDKIEKKHDFSIIDLDVKLFSAIAPSLEGLMYLGHSRVVELDNKAFDHKRDPGHQPQPSKGVSAQAAGKTDYSVIIGNRLPVAPANGDSNSHNIKHRAFLVSLEGYADFLPSKSGVPSTRLADFRKVRLVVFKSWGFSTTPNHLSLIKSFGEINDHQKSKLWHLQLPPISDSENPDEKTVNQALAMGYIALPHHMRESEKTVSWYRSPLIPCKIDTTQDPFVPAHCSDSALRYDKGTGMFNTSYAAAWQLGRLLALQNNSFAQGWARQRIKKISKTKSILNAKRLCEKVGIFSSTPGQGKTDTGTQLLGKMKTGIDQLTKSLSDQKDQKEAAKDESNGIDLATPPPFCIADSDEHFQTLQKTLTDSKAISQHHQNYDAASRNNSAANEKKDDLHGNVYEWLGHLGLLHGVPFSYLVPDTRMLPAESLRFFFVDPNWIDYLLDGACSIGRNSKVDHAHDAAFAGQTKEKAYIALSTLRKRRLKGSAAKPSKTPIPGLMSGFLLRSRILTNWPGMEVQAFGSQDGIPLDVLRLDHLAESLLLGIFKGEIHTLRFGIPQEALHFGFDGDLKKILRKKSGDTSETEITAPFRDGNQRVISIDTLVNEMMTGLNLKNFTSADFALQMIQEHQQVDFIKSEKKS